jgi:hypothetical protein
MSYLTKGRGGLRIWKAKSIRTEKLPIFQVKTEKTEIRTLATILLETNRMDDVRKLPLA